MKKTPDHLFSRRESLRFIGVGGAAALVGLAGKTRHLWPALSPRDPDSPACLVKPAQTEGPYFIDERLNRADIRNDPATNSVKDGVPLRLKINVAKLGGAGGCSPLAGAFVDLWQCDALGVYSDVKDIGGRFDTRGQKFLRGYQVTDSNGSVEMITIYPGWYPGRTVHIHFKIRLFAGSQRAHEFTSQFYFDDSLTDSVYTRAPYNTNGTRKTRNAGDGIFRTWNTGSQLTLDLAPDGQGYFARFDIGLAGLS